MPRMAGKGLRLPDRTRLVQGPVQRKELRRIQLREGAGWVKVADVGAYGLAGVPDGWWATEGNSGVTVTKYDFDWRPTGDSFEAPTGGGGDDDRVRGIAYDGASLWVVGYNPTAYEVDPETGDTVSSFGVSNNPSGIAYDGNDLWIVDENSNTLHRYTTGGSKQQEEALSGDAQRGIAYWHGDLYMVMRVDATVVRLSTADASLLSRIDVSAVTGNPTGVWVEGDGTLYVAEVGVGVWRRKQRLEAP